MFLDASSFACARVLEQNFETILDGYQGLRVEDFQDWHERHHYRGVWKVFGLYIKGNQVVDNCAKVPKIVKVLHQIPNLHSAGFSYLGPRTKIQYHYGTDATVLRCHLGIEIPEKCEIKILGEKKEWLQGECLVFDDTYFHSAKNLSKSPRVIFGVDFKKPEQLRSSLTTSQHLLQFYLDHTKKVRRYAFALSS